MKRLNEMIDNAEALAAGLKETGRNHRSYKDYTSMSRALAFLCTGHLYLSDGSGWNDQVDREMVKAKKVYATCFSCSTDENIALWMLYGRNNGKNGAMLNYLPSVMKSVLSSQTVEIGKFSSKEFEAGAELSRAADDFEIFLTDIIYTGDCEKNRVRLTLSDIHVTVDDDVIDHNDIFHKKYPWAYEQECRLVVRLSRKWREKAAEKNYTHIRITVAERELKKMKERIVRSPVYDGDVTVGKASALMGKVDWKL